MKCDLAAPTPRRSDSLQFHQEIIIQPHGSAWYFALISFDIAMLLGCSFFFHLQVTPIWRSSRCRYLYLCGNSAFQLQSWGIGRRPYLRYDGGNLQGTSMFPTRNSTFCQQRNLSALAAHRWYGYLHLCLPAPSGSRCVSNLR